MLHCSTEGVAQTANATSGIHNCWMSVSQLAFEATLCSIAYAYCRGLGAELSAYCAEFRDLV